MRFNPLLVSITEHEGGQAVDQFEVKQKKDVESFGFKFSKDILKIYKLNCSAFGYASDACVEAGFGN